MSSRKKQKLELLRSEIDSTHDQILKLFFYRIKLAQRILRLKKQMNLPRKDKSRERNMILHAMKKYKNQKQQKAAEKLIRNIIRSSRVFFEK